MTERREGELEEREGVLEKGVWCVEKQKKKTKGEPREDVVG
jgi:hypothetical protein